MKKFQNDGNVEAPMLKQQEGDGSVKRRTFGDFFICGAFAFVTVGCVICISLVAVEMFKISEETYYREMSGKKESSETLRSSPIACVACALMQTDPSQDVKDDPLLSKLSTIREHDDPHLKCCAFDSEQMSTLLEATMRRKEPSHDELEKYNVSNFQFSPVSAHMRFYPPKGFNKHSDPVFFKNGQLLRVTFREPNEIAFNDHVRGVTVEEEGLRLRYSGLYMVYSSIEYRPHYRRFCEELPIKQWFHGVYSQGSFSREKKLLETAYTCCSKCHHVENTRFTSGVFMLKKGDVISVKVMGYGLHYYGKHVSYLGLVMLGSMNSEEKEM